MEKIPSDLKLSTKAQKVSNHRQRELLFYALHKQKVSKLEQSRMFNEQNHVAFVIVCVTWTCNYGVLKDVAEYSLGWIGLERNGKGLTLWGDYVAPVAPLRLPARQPARPRERATQISAISKQKRNESKSRIAHLHSFTVRQHSDTDTRYNA